MAHRTQVDISGIAGGPSAEVHVTVNDALQTSVAEQYGLVIGDVEGIQSFHQILYAQAGFLLANAGITGPPDSFTRRSILVDHKREQTLFAATNDITPSGPAHLQVVLPYTPQYGYLQDLEAERGLPLRMTFGVAQPIVHDGTDRIRVARANLWVTHDRLAPLPGGFRALKDIVPHPVPVTPDEAASYFASSKRSRYRAAFAVERRLQHLGKI